MIKKSLFRREVGLEEIIPGFRIEADFRGKSASLVISGAKGIKEFSSNAVIVKAKRGGISIEGDALSISVFEGGSVGVSGEIDRISFLDARRGRGR